MRLNIFDTWKPLPIRFGRTLEYQTKKAAQTNNVYKTTVRDVKTQTNLFSVSGMSSEGAEKKAARVLDSINADEVQRAIHSGAPIQYSKDIDSPKLQITADEIPWRDGINHRSRYQHKTGRGETRVHEAVKKPETFRQRINNLVAKHAAINKAGPMKDKTAYRRKEKHKKAHNDQ